MIKVDPDVYTVVHFIAVWTFVISVYQALTTAHASYLDYRKQKKDK